MTARLAVVLLPVGALPVGCLLVGVLLVGALLGAPGAAAQGSDPLGPGAPERSLLDLGPSREADLLPPPERCAVDACRARWPSFRAADCSIQPVDGPRRYCTEDAAVFVHERAHLGAPLRRAPPVSALGPAFAPPPQPTAAPDVAEGFAGRFALFFAGVAALGFPVAALRFWAARRRIAADPSAELSVTGRADFGRQRVTSRRRGRIVAGLSPLEEAPPSTTAAPGAAP